VLVSAVIVNLDQREKLLECVRSVEGALARVEESADVTVVDNGSRDGSADAVRAAHPAVRVIEAGRNLGFAGGVELGVQASEGEWVLLLNNDATLEPDAVAELLHAAEGRPRVGSVAAQLRFADGSERINSAGFGVDRLGVAYERRLGEPGDPPEEEPQDVFGASGGAAIFRRAMLEELGGLDTSFFVYLEDVDLAWRARAAGWTALYAPAAIAHHHHSLTAGHGSPFKYFHVGRNRVRVLAKNAPTRHLLRYGPAIAVYDLAYCLFVLAADRSAAPLRGRLRGLREWRRYRQRPPAAAAEVLEPVRGLRAAVGRRRAWEGRPGRRTAA
jgi:GT2 family glycosyltransferase